MIIKTAEFACAFGTKKQLPKAEKPEIVFSGRSNVGKSSLINKLCNRKSLARTSAQPGKTGTINFYKVNEFFFVDLPGYGFAKVSDKERKRWDNLINGYFNQSRDVRMVVQLIDSRHEPTKDDITMLEYLTYYKFPFVIALTKCDKLNKTEQSAAVEKLSEYCKDYAYSDIILTSAEKGIGTERLLYAIEKSLVD